MKSRVRGDFHARFCERVRVKLPRSTRPLILSTGSIVKSSTKVTEESGIVNGYAMENRRFMHDFSICQAVE